MNSHLYKRNSIEDTLRAAHFNMSSAILHSLGPKSLANNYDSIPLNDNGTDKCGSVHILDDQENLLISSEADFVRRLEIAANDKVKVVSIFGNTGEGKSYTMNHAFFEGREVFKTSPQQSSCTLGVWAKYNRQQRVLCLDTEGLLGISKKEHQRTRLLLKILAVSDVIIYRTKAERLPRDMYTFLGGASKAYRDHFNSALEKVFQKYEIDKPAPAFGPCLVIFHETRYTDTLKMNSDIHQSPEDIVRENFAALNESFDGFSAIKYIGFKNSHGRTSFDELKLAVEQELESTHVRSARNPMYVYLTIKGLNEKFQRIITDIPPQLYLPAFFTCQDKCLSCGAGCTLSMGHKDEDVSHCNQRPCILQHQYQNFVYICKRCNDEGRKQIVEPSYQAANESSWSNILTSVWSGYIIECPKCGKIYQSREYWYGNKDPMDEAVLKDIIHVWPGEKHYFQGKSLLGSHNSAQKVLDGVASFSNVVTSVGSQPTKMITDWLTDQIAPPYWRRNDDIVECFKCKLPLGGASKHHCRACGEGFCEGCSSRAQPVPWRGWTEPVRVCDDCFQERPPSLGTVADEAEVRSRRLGESVLSSMSVVRTVFEYPKEVIKQTARPTYWTPDEECLNCTVCDLPFGLLVGLHHCRDCGKGVCDSCSNNRKAVPLRNWDSPVRVCNKCYSS